MLSAIGDFLSGIVDFFQMLFGFIFDLFSGLGKFCSALWSAPGTIGDLLNSGFIPPILIGTILACLTTWIILRIIGRSS